RAPRAGNDLLPINAREPQNYRGKSPVSARSRCRLSRSSSIVITGLRGGGPRPTELGGVIQPCRTASNSSASASTGLRVWLGGQISATTRSRSVTRTVSPPAASRMYSLNLFLSVLRPTERMIQCSYQRLKRERVISRQRRLQMLIARWPPSAFAWFELDSSRRHR